MIRVRRAEERGVTRTGWLDSRHSFSFAEYFDPEQMGFSSLRVLNDDRIAPGGGFGMHPHRDMEILTVVLDGAVEHRDSLGSGSVIRPGDVQLMTAGRGILHSEFNPSAEEPLHLLQVWLLPERAGLQPEYREKSFGEELEGRLRLIVSPDGRDNSLVIHQDASVYQGRLRAGQEASHSLAPGRRAWVHVARGTAELNGTPLAAGDAGVVEAETELRLLAVDDAEVLLFDLA
ncbi:MAG: pirin family protein [Armatimonadota bacterium]